MKKTWKSLCGALALVASMGAAAEDVGIYGNNIGVGTNAANPLDFTWYFADYQNVGGLVADSFDGLPIGAFAAGSAAYLSAAEFMTFQDPLSGQTVDSATFNWRVYKNSSAAPGAFNSVVMALAAEVATVADFGDAAGNVYAAVGDKLWTATPGVNFLSGLDADTYTLEAYFAAAYTTGTLYSQNCPGGDPIYGFQTCGLVPSAAPNYKATFQITDANNVPEPSALALAGLSLALLAATRRRKH